MRMSYPKAMTVILTTDEERNVWMHARKGVATATPCPALHFAVI
jgi:hypothetical protein